MSAPAPEAENEYSKGDARPRSRSGRRTPRPSRASWAVTAVGLVGAALLIVAEFTALYVLHVSTYGAQPTSVSAGSHNAYALVPIAVLAAALALAGARRGNVAALWALVALGIVAVLIAVVGDLPDTRARGITHGVAFASTTAGTGLYLETLGRGAAAWRRAGRACSRGCRTTRRLGGPAGVSLRRGRAARACRDERPASRHPDKASVNGSKPGIRGYI